MCQVWAAHACWINSFQYNNQLSPKLSGLKQQHLSAHSCWGSETQVRLSSSSASESLTGGKVLGRDVVVSRFTGEGHIPKFTHMVVGRVHFLLGFWTESFNSLLAVGQEQFSVPRWVSLQHDNLLPQREHAKKSKERARECWQENGSGKIDIIAV